MDMAEYQQARLQKPGTDKNPDSFVNRLQQINEVLSRSEDRLRRALTGLEGETPINVEEAAKMPSPSVACFLMEINARSQRILVQLEKLNAIIG